MKDSTVSAIISFLFFVAYSYSADLILTIGALFFCGVCLICAAIEKGYKNE